MVSTASKIYNTSLLIPAEPHLEPPNITEMSPREVVVSLWIDGKAEFAQLTFDVISPRTHPLAREASSASTKDAIRAVGAAQAAFSGWFKTKPLVRQKILLKAADLLEERMLEYGHFVGSEIGAAATTQNWILPLGFKT